MTLHDSSIFFPSSSSCYCWHLLCLSVFVCIYNNIMKLSHKMLELDDDRWIERRKKEFSNHRRIEWVTRVMRIGKTVKHMYRHRPAFVILSCHSHYLKVCGRNQREKHKSSLKREPSKAFIHLSGAINDDQSNECNWYIGNELEILLQTRFLVFLEENRPICWGWYEQQERKRENNSK